MTGDVLRLIEYLDWSLVKFTRLSLSLHWVAATKKVRKNDFLFFKILSGKYYLKGGSKNMR